ncbi:Fc.00g050780.m01.CDS01 [Cosmosporella sp. VM-42]
MGFTEFRPMLAPTSKRRNFQPTVETHFFTKDTIKPHTIILIGSLLQLILCAILPLRWAIVPPSIFLLNSIITTIFQLLSTRPNEYTSTTVPGRVTAQLPLKDGTFGTSPASQPIVLFNLGVQWNHPLGLLAPGVPELAKQFMAMNKDLKARREELGLLGLSTWRGDERLSNNTLVTTYYFKDVESIHRFAHEPLHRQAWDNFGPNKYSHIGIFHETFCVPAKAWETVYVNCSPILMGRAAEKVKVKGEGEGEMWVNSLDRLRNSPEPEFRLSEPTDIMDRFFRMGDVANAISEFKVRNLTEEKVQRVIDRDDPTRKRVAVVALWVLQENLPDGYDRSEELVKETLEKNGVKDYE